jgi:glycosyltransferase involved in cell wall biosynthesis
MAINKLLINASNVHSGGASILLNYFLNEADFSGYSSITLALDARCILTPKVLTNFVVIRVTPTLLGRMWNEVKICFFYGDLLCFGNLPPLFWGLKNTTVFLHNALYFEPELCSKFGLKARIRLVVESFLFRIRLQAASKFLVQSPHMKRRLCELSVDPKKIIIAPFADVHPKGKGIVSSGSFICVSSGDAHKNVMNLILAWEILAQESLSPRLLLTLNQNQYPDLAHWIKLKIDQSRLNIINLGTIDRDEIDDVYRTGAALISPSLIESFGLPLIEAREAGVDILAPELDYVRDVVSPVETFDPQSPLSISRAVKRYLGVSESLVRLRTPSEVLKIIFD